MNKILKSLIFGTILIIICLGTLSALYECNIKSHIYNYKTIKLKDIVEELNCYNNTLLLKDTNLQQECLRLVNEHNNITKKWNSLNCIS